MKKPVAFISHSTADKAAARSLADALRKVDIDPWVDAEKIEYGSSILAAIEAGLETADVILVLISRKYLSSPWMRAEYEPLLKREFEQQRTIVIPVRLDSADIPTFLSTKRYVDLRNGMQSSSVKELGDTIAALAGATRVKRLVPDHGSRSAETVLSMIVTSMIKDLPAEGFSRDELLEGRSLMDLYRAVEALIDKFQEVIGEFIRALSGFDWAWMQSNDALREPNRKLRRIATDMRDLAESLDAILRGDSEILARLKSVLELCTAIYTTERGLMVGIGAPTRLGEDSIGRTIGVEVRDYPWGYVPSHYSMGGVPDQLDPLQSYHATLEQLDDYRVTLRKAVADASTGESC